MRGVTYNLVTQQRALLHDQSRPSTGLCLPKKSHPRATALEQHSEHMTQHLVREHNIPAFLELSSPPTPLSLPQAAPHTPLVPYGTLNNSVYH